MEKTEEENLELLHLFRHCAHLQRRSRSDVPGQGYILILLRQHGPMTQRELTERIQRRSATLCEQVESMEKAGLITRTKNAQDKRNIDISLTAAGEEAAVLAEQKRTQMANELFGPLSDEEKDQLSRMLRKLCGLWESIESKNGDPEAGR